LSKYLQVGPPHDQVPDTPQSTHLTIVTTCSCSTQPHSHLSTSTPLLIAFSSPSCQLCFSPQPSPHNLTEGHFCSQWLFPPHSLYLFLSTFLTCCVSAFLGRATLFGQPHRTCPTSPHPQHCHDLDLNPKLSPTFIGLLNNLRDYNIPKSIYSSGQVTPLRK